MQFYKVSIFFLSAFLFFLTSSVSAQSFTIKNPEIALSINGRNFSPKSLWVLNERVLHSEHPIPFKKLIDTVIENRLLAVKAEQELGDSIMSTSSVGYPETVHLENQYIGLLQSAYYQRITTDLSRLLGNKPGDLYSDRFSKIMPELKKILNLGKLMQYEIPKQYRSEAAKLILTKFRFPGASFQVVTLADLYNRENIQGKILFNQLNINFMKLELKKLIYDRAIEWWAQHYSGLTISDIQNLKLFLKDRRAKQKLLNTYGLSLDMHEDNSALEKARKQVTPKEIANFYDIHKNDFKRVDFVKVRHIRLADEKSARIVQRQLASGMSFSDAVKKYSIAKDKNTIPPGNLGKVIDQGAKKSWMQSIVFILAPGKPGKPIRSPQIKGKAYWEIFLVDKRVEGYYPKNSETVAYIASRKIAFKKLEEAFLKLRARLFDKAKIGINKQALALINKQ